MFSSAVSFGGGFLTGDQLKGRRGELLQAMFGGDPKKFDEQSPWELVRKNADAIRGKVALRLCVGTKDGLAEPNRRMKALLEELKIPFEYEEVPDVGHDPRKMYSAAGLKGFKFTADHFGRP